jgi:hypothetical protein
MHAALGAVRIGEITFLHGQPAKILARQRPHLAQLTHEEIGERLVRLLLMALVALLVFLMRLMILVVLMSLVLLMRLRLMLRLARHLLAALSRSLLYASEPAELDIHQPVHSIELGLQILEARVVLALQLIDQLVELRLMGVDLFLEQRRSVLQVPANITHRMPPH